MLLIKRDSRGEITEKILLCTKVISQWDGIDKMCIEGLEDMVSDTVMNSIGLHHKESASAIVFRLTEDVWFVQKDRNAQPRKSTTKELCEQFGLDIYKLLEKNDRYIRLADREVRNEMISDIYELNKYGTVIRVLYYLMPFGATFEHATKKGFFYEDIDKSSNKTVNDIVKAGGEGLEEYCKIHKIKLLNGRYVSIDYR